MPFRESSSMPRNGMSVIGGMVFHGNAQEHHYCQVWLALIRVKRTNHKEVVEVVQEVCHTIAVGENPVEGFC